MKRSFSLGFTLLGTWLLWSGHFTSLLIGLGILSCLLVVALCRRMEIVDSEGHPSHLFWKLLVYIPWLLWAVVKANLDVARRILHPALPISPCLIQVKASQKTELARVLYANSITLTPGTVSVEVDGDTITVHALTRQSAGELMEGEMDRRVKAVEGEA